MSSIEIKKISITALDTDAIVNAANDGLWAGKRKMPCDGPNWILTKGNSLNQWI